MYFRVKILICLQFMIFSVNVLHDKSNQVFTTETSLMLESFSEIVFVFYRKLYSLSYLLTLF